MIKPRKYSILVAWLVIVLCATGCGSSGPVMVPIRGQVFYKGEPLKGVPQGLVRYLPKDSSRGRQASGRLQPDGTFVLTTFASADGVVVGDYDITVSAYSSSLTRAQTEAGTRSGGPKLLIPEKYTTPEASGLGDAVNSKHTGFKKIELD
jgi:hypothetical protein